MLPIVFWEIDTPTDREAPVPPALPTPTPTAAPMARPQMELSDEEVDLTCDRLIGLMSAPDSVKTGLMAKYGGDRAVDAMLSWLK